MIQKQLMVLVVGIILLGLSSCKTYTIPLDCIMGQLACVKGLPLYYTLTTVVMPNIAHSL